MAPSDEAPPSRILVAATVSFYMAAAISMVLANKWVLNATDVPVFFLIMQLLIAVVLLAICGATGLLKIPLRIDLAICKALVPMITINILGLNFNNLTLKFSDASFYQVARGLLLPITVVLSSVILHTRPSRKILYACAVVTAGFLVGILLDGQSSGGSTTSIWGILFGILSSCTTALHAVVIKRSLEAVKGSTLQLAWYSNVLSAIAMVPIVFLAGEAPKIFALLFEDQPVMEGSTVSPFWTFIWGCIVTGVVGFAICIAGFLSIKVTSPITHMVSAAARGVLQTGMSVLILKETVSNGRASSIGIILGGSVWYTWIKNEELVAKEQEANSAPLQLSDSQRSEVLFDDDEEASKLEAGEHDSNGHAYPSETANGKSGGYESVPMEPLGSRSRSPPEIRINGQ